MKIYPFLFFLSLLSCKSLIPGKDSQSILFSKIVTSKYLSTDIEFFTFDLSDEVSEKSIIYFTDGQKMIDNGVLDEIMRLKQIGKIPPSYYVFVSTIDSETGTDNRNDYFFCNEDYLLFFEKELVPLVEQQIESNIQPQNRSLVGISFGGLNAAYFSAASTIFQNFGLLSPIIYPCIKINEQIVFSQNKDLNIFLSTGIMDAESYVETLVSLYQQKAYKFKKVKTTGGHDFENWINQLEDLLTFLANNGQE